MSNSMQLYGQQPTRLFCPQGSPGKNTGVGCQFLLPMSIECHPTISSSVTRFSSCPQSFPASGAFQMSQLHIRWPKYWSFSFKISPSNEHPGLIFRMDWLDFLAIQGTQESSPTPQFKSINSSVFSFLYSPTLTSIHDHWKNNSLD